MFSLGLGKELNLFEKQHDMVSNLIKAPNCHFSRRIGTFSPSSKPRWERWFTGKYSLMLMAWKTRWENQDQELLQIHEAVLLPALWITKQMKWLTIVRLIQIALWCHSPEGKDSQSWFWERTEKKMPLKNGINPYMSVPLLQTDMFSPVKV